MDCGFCEQPLKFHRYIQNSRMYLGRASFFCITENSLTQHNLTEEEEIYFFNNVYGREEKPNGYKANQD
jgi:hypothetical protein